MIGVVCSTIDPVQERHFQCECIPEELESADADAESVSALSADATPTACGPARDSPSAKAAAPTCTAVLVLAIFGIPFVMSAAVTSVETQKYRIRRDNQHRRAPENADSRQARHWTRLEP